MGAPVVAGGDAPPILELGEHVLDLVALAIEHLVMIDRLLTAPDCWDAGLDAPVGQRPAQPIAIVTLSPIRMEADGKASIRSLAPLWSLI